MTSPAHRTKTMSIGGATFDLFVRLHQPLEAGKNADIRFPVGAKIPVHEIIETCGGGASNTAVGLARLGCDAAFCGVVGNDQWGEKLLENLRREGVDTSAATVVEGENSSSSIILSVSGGERVILYNTGANAHLADPTFDRENAATREWIFLNHINEQSCEIDDDLLRILEERTRSVGFTWNPGGCQIEQGIKRSDIAALLKHTRLLLLNKEEALAFARAPDERSAISLLLGAGVQTVCITDGANGSMAADATRTYACPVITNTSIVDTTGAGDAFGVGMTWGILRGMDLPNCLRAGTINAASVLGFLGAQAGLLTDIEMQKRLQTTQLDVREIP